MTRATLMAGLVALGGVSSGVFAAPPGSYTLTDLSTLGGQQSIATGINNSGQVVGTSSLFGDTVGNGYVYTFATGLVDTSSAAPNTAGTNSNARAISESGAIVGYFGNHASAFTTAKTVIDLGILGGTFSAAFGVGPNSVVVGGSETGGVDGLGYPLSEAFQTSFPTSSPAGALTPLGVVAPFNSSSAYGIGKSSPYAVVGSSYYANPFTTASVATLFAGGSTPTSLGALPGGTSSVAYAAGSSFAVGVSSDSSGVFHPVTFSLSPAGTVADLGLLPGYANGVAYGVNATNQIVGNAFNLDSSGNVTTYHGFLYSGGSLYDLNSLLSSASAGNTVEDAVAINDYGQVAADGINVNGQIHAFLLSPTPVVTSLSPSSVPSGTTSIPTLTITGTNFAPDAVVYVNGSPVPTTFVSATQVTASVSSLPNSGGVTVDVGTPTPGGNGQVLPIGSASLSPSIGSFTTDTVNKQYDLTVTLTNTGNVPATNVVFTLGTLKSTRPVSSTVSYTSVTTTGTGTIPASGSETWTLVFPASALPSNSTTALASVNGTFSYGTSSGSFSIGQTVRGFTTLTSP